MSDRSMPACVRACSSCVSWAYCHHGDRPAVSFLCRPATWLPACRPAGPRPPERESSCSSISHSQPPRQLRFLRVIMSVGCLGAAPPDDVHALPGVPAGDWPRPVAHIPRPYVRQEHAALRHVTCLRLCLPFHLSIHRYQLYGQRARCGFRVNCMLRVQP